MATFLTTRGTSYEIENIIMEAREKLILVSPFLQLSKTLLERLTDTSKRGVKIQIIYGKDELKPNEKNSMAKLSTVSLFYHQNLHAKCYLNEKKMVITSMNMYQFSENTNREMGISIDIDTEPDLYKKAYTEVESILEHSEVEIIRPTERVYYGEIKDSNSFNSRMGYCIRCETRIPLDAYKPYCGDCFLIWAQFENPFYEEAVCHSCGEFTKTTIEKPLCYKCYKKQGAL